MKTEMRFAGLFASISFMVVTFAGIYATMNPAQSLVYGIASAILVGGIGHRMGYILTHPDKRHMRNQMNRRAVGPSAPDPLDFKPLTGEETFLDDLPL